MTELKELKEQETTKNAWAAVFSFGYFFFFIFLYFTVGFSYPELAICGPSGQVCGSWTAEQGCLAYNPTYDPSCTQVVGLIVALGLVAILMSGYLLGIYLIKRAWK